MMSSLFRKPALSLLLMPGASQAATFVIPASVDGFVQDSGANGFSSGDAEATIRTSRSGGSNVRHGIYEFDVSSIPSNFTITSASFTVTTAGSVSDTDSFASIRVDGYTGDGSITTGDYDNLEASGGDLVGSVEIPVGGATPINSEITIPLIDLSPLETAHDDAGQIFGLRSETTNFTTFTVHSLETSNNSVTVPTLTVVAIPEPDSFLLSIFALSVVGWKRCRSGWKS